MAVFICVIVRPDVGARKWRIWMFEQVREFCGRCPWLSVRYAVWMPAFTDI